MVHSKFSEYSRSQTKRNKLQASVPEMEQGFEYLTGMFLGTKRHKSYGSVTINTKAQGLLVDTISLHGHILAAVCPA
ncbi:hypothetical protein BaRGS_00018034 [Batillaria attramentaria]|uniref:Uncharacterized protein n=1 Tax=Batillaria attramentaria TaxID=370345 RepID=A0ABD0KUG8_9CAEN